MKINKKLFIILLFAICIVSLLFGSVAYYRFLVSGNINGSTGNAVFNVTGFKDDSSSIKTIELGKVSPGDSGEFTITLDASGSTVDMYATLTIDRGDSSNNTELPTNLKFYTTPDHKSELHKYYSFLETTGTQKEELTIYWYWNPFISDEEDNKYINREFSANIKVSAVQISEYAMMKNGYSGTEFWNNTYKPYIRTITFGNDLSNKPENCTGDSDLCWDVSNSSSQKKKVYAYLMDSGLKDSTDSTKVLYNLYIVSDAPIFAPKDCSMIFSLGATINSKYTTNLVSIDFNDNFNTSLTTIFCAYDLNSNKGMFYRCNKIEKLDLSGFNTKKMTDMRGMFKSCSSLTSLDLSSFNTSKVLFMIDLFLGCSKIESIELSNFNTSKVTRMGGMFYSCSSLTNLDLSGFNTSNVTEMHGMFKDCSSLTNLNLSIFNTINVKSFFYMFSKCSSLANLDIGNFNTSNATNMGSMFEDCSSLTNLDLSNFNTSKVTNMMYMFANCSSLTILDLNSFNTSMVRIMENMFEGCSLLTNLYLSNFNTSNVTSMTHMFEGCEKIQVEINILNSDCTYSYMFSSALTDPDAYVILGYTTDTQAIAKGMKGTTYFANQFKITLKQI